MMLDDKPFDSISADDILDLVPDVAEGRRIDYKASLPEDGEKGVRSFLADVCALANSAGGFLLYGVGELRDETGVPTGIPDSVCGIGAANGDATIRAWQQRITQSIEPVVIGHRVRIVDGFGDQSRVMLVYVPKSLLGPHRVNYQGKKDFYVRHDRSNLPMDIGEIRQAFVEAREIPQRVDELRRLRISQILAGETPVELLPDTPIFACHVIPLSSFSPDAAVDVAGLQGHKSIDLMDQGAGNGRLNADGFLFRCGMDGDHCRCYAQVYRSGVIETAATFADVASLRPGRRVPLLPSQWQEAGFIRTLSDAVGLLRDLNVPPPVYVGLALLRVRGMAMALPQRFFEQGQPIDKDLLIVPVVTSETLAEEPAGLLRPAFDAVWQASGYPASPYYGAAGNWSSS
jgi:hypothetical protein